MRYYNADSVETPAKRTKRIQTEKESTFSRRLARVRANLPQKLIFIAILVLLFLNTTMSSVATRLDDQNNAYRTAEEYKQGIDDIFNSSFLNKSKLTFRSTSFERDVQAKYPEMSDVVAVVPLAGRELHVNVSFTAPLLRLVDAKGELIGIVGEQGNFIQLSGESSQLNMLMDVPTLQLLESPTFEQGSQLLTSVETELVTTMLSEFDGSGEYRPTVQSILFDVVRREMQVRFIDTGYYARITPERDAREQVGALVATLKQLTEDNDMPTRYIDVRVEGRVFVR